MYNLNTYNIYLVYIIYNLAIKLNIIVFKKQYWLLSDCLNLIKKIRKNKEI